MKDETLKSVLQALVDEHLSPDPIQLLPGIQKRLVARNHPLYQQGEFMNRTSLPQRRTFRVAVSISALIFLLVILIATPPGRAFAQRLLAFFNRTENNALTVPTLQASLEPVETHNAVKTPIKPVPSTANETGCGTIFAPSCSLEQVQPRVRFPIQVLPDSTGAARLLGMMQYEDGVLLSYDFQGSLFLIETPSSKTPEKAWQVSQDAAVEAVTIGSQPGEYVQGAWGGMLEDGNVPWNASVPTQTLRWASDGIQYTLVYIPEKSVDGKPRMEPQQLIAMAAGIKHSDQVTAPETEQQGLTLRQIEQQTGFTVTEPGWLPERFTLQHLRYNSEHNAACLYYDTDSNISTPGLVIAQSTWALPLIEDLQVQASYNGQPVEIPTQITPVTVRGAITEQGILASNGLAINKFCGGEEQVANRALLWQSGVRTYIIFARIDNYNGTSYVTRQEMIRLAEMLNGISAAEATILDPERLFSVHDAKMLTGVELPSPTKMLTNVHLDHIAYPNLEGDLANGGGPKMLAQLLYTGAESEIFGKDHILITFTPDSDWTLEERELAGGFGAQTVRGQPGLYQEACWQMVEESRCTQTLIWLEGGAGYEVSSTFPALVPKAMLLEIAESLR